MREGGGGGGATNHTYNHTILGVVEALYVAM